ncbi:MAG: Clp1/GlmU family protein [Desulfurococcaceae archaeon]
MPIVKLLKTEAIRAFGPMAIEVAKGIIEVLGKRFHSGEKLVVHKTRNYIIEAVEDSELYISMADESLIQPLDPDDPYFTRKNIAKEIIEKGHKVVVVIGGTDVGKTSFTTLLANIALARGLRPAIIDGDVGQADIGPPGFVSMGFPTTLISWNTEIKPLVMRFVGDIKPQHSVHVIVSELYRLIMIGKARNFEPIIIDTDGWVKDEHAISYKHLLIRSLRPDAIVIIDDGLRDYFAKFKKVGIEIYSVKSPAIRKVRTREERRLLRSIRYREFLENAPLVKIDMNNVIIEGYPLFYGTPVNTSELTQLMEGRIIYASILMNNLHVYGIVKSYNIDELKKRFGIERVKIYQLGSERNIYCSVGIIDGNEYPCIVEKFDFDSYTMLIRTKYSDKIEIIKLSKIKLRDDYTEEMIED